ncbi:methionyl-tRNA formyltransferase, partial [Bartonella sp. MR168JLCBS]
MGLRLSFMGTPHFSVPILHALLDAGHDIVAVYSQPPRPAGRRGLKMIPSPVQNAAQAKSIPVFTPQTLKTAEKQAQFAELAVDVAIVVAYGLFLPKAILETPRLGCFNAHASLLPRWRGAAPIQRAIMA